MKVPILLPNIFDHPFTYEKKISNSLKVGDFVRVPFGSTEQTGVVWNFEEESKKKIKLKQIIKKLDLPGMNTSMIKFIAWFARYNMVPLGMSLKMSLLSKDIVERCVFIMINEAARCLEEGVVEDSRQLGGVQHST